MTSPFRLTCVQVNAGNQMAANIEAAAQLARAAHGDGAYFIAFPECVAMMEMGRDAVLARARPEETHPALAAICDLANDPKVWLLSGSLSVRLPGDKVANRSFLIDSEGAIQARYDKLHMFDVNLEDGESYRESATFQPGAAAMLAKTPWGKLGMTVCYDLRFSQLYRDLAQSGAALLAVPSAFTRPTGQAHWEVLMRARAIENAAYVFAPAQRGETPPRPAYPWPFADRRSVGRRAGRWRRCAGPYHRRDQSRQGGRSPPLSTVADPRPTLPGPGLITAAVRLRSCHF